MQNETQLYITKVLEALERSRGSVVEVTKFVKGPKKGTKRRKILAAIVLALKERGYNVVVEKRGRSRTRTKIYVYR